VVNKWLQRAEEDASRIVALYAGFESAFFPWSGETPSDVKPRLSTGLLQLDAASTNYLVIIAMYYERSTAARLRVAWYRSQIAATTSV
jgi:hypothetical protein